MSRAYRSLISFSGRARMSISSRFATYYSRVLQDHGLQWQFVFDRGLPGLGPIQGTGPVRETFWIDRGIQHEGTEFGHGFRVTSQEIPLELVHARVVIPRGTERLGGAPIVGRAESGQFAATFGVRHGMPLLLGLKRRSRCGFLTFVPRCAAEQLTQPTGRWRSELFGGRCPCRMRRHVGWVQLAKLIAISPAVALARAGHLIGVPGSLPGGDALRPS
jgi:hypothetical protein